MAVRVSGKIRRVLVDAGVVAEADWSSVKDSGASPLEALVERGRLGEGALLEALGRASSVPPVDLSRAQPDKAALEALSQETCLEFGVLPSGYRCADDHVVLAGILVQQCRKCTECQHEHCAAG